jgi:hypothetical protein
MSGVIEFIWPSLTLEHDIATGWTNTRYPDGRTSGCAPVPEDAFHAEALGITPERHRLVHELLHHLVGFTFGYAGSPVIWRDAHGQAQAETLFAPMQPPCDLRMEYLTAEIEEWIVTAYTYALYGKPHDAGAMMDVRRLCGTEPEAQLRRHLQHALRAADAVSGIGGNAKMVMSEWPTLALWAEVGR